MVEQQDLQGVISEKAKIEPAMVIRIDLNQLNKMFTYKKLYLKNVHKCRQPLQVVGAVGGQKCENAEKKYATEGHVNVVNLNQ